MFPRLAVLTQKQESIDIIYIDFKKAFDSLVYSKIIAKLSAYGIGYELLSWIQVFLTGRTQRVIVDNALSSSIDVSSGVVQGSVLGPLIFLLFIDDIVDCLVSDDIDPTSCCIFAHDLKLYSSYNVNSDNSSLSNSLRNIEKWSNQWQLLINPDKSLLLHIGNKLQTRREYFICNKLISHLVSFEILVSHSLQF